MNTEELIINRYKECIQKGLEFYGIRISEQKREEQRGIVFDVTGKVAGYYCYNSGDMKQYPDFTHIFRVNLEMAERNLDDYLKETIPHEVAHYLHKLLNPRSREFHGWEWGEIMIRVFNLSPKRCHEYSIPGYHVYTCRCGKTLEVSPTIHNKIIKGQKRLTRCHNYELTSKDYVGIVE